MQQQKCTVVARAFRRIYIKISIAAVAWLPSNFNNISESNCGGEEAAGVKLEAVFLGTEAQIQVIFTSA